VIPLAQEQFATQKAPIVEAPKPLPRYAVETILGPVPDYLDNPREHTTLLGWVEDDLGKWLESQNLDTIPCRLEELVDEIGSVSIRHLAAGLLHHSSCEFRLLLKKRAVVERAREREKELLQEEEEEQKPQEPGVVQKVILHAGSNWSAPANKYLGGSDDRPLKVVLAESLDKAFDNNRVGAEARAIAKELNAAVPNSRVTSSCVSLETSSERKRVKPSFDTSILDRPAGEIIDGWNGTLTLREAIARALDEATLQNRAKGKTGRIRIILAEFVASLTEAGYPVSANVLKARVARERRFV